MAYDGLINSFLGQGLAADRPAAPNIHPGAIAFYYSTDSDELSAWVEGAWEEDIIGGGSLTDGDYGDIVASGGGTVLTVDPAVISVYGRTLTSVATAVLARGILGLGTAAVEPVGTFAVTKATRTSMAGFTASTTVYLSEAGREGIFVWDPSNLLTLVTADVQQGIYVPPTGGDGSTGAWVRKYNGPIHTEWFGSGGAGVAAAVALATALAGGNLTGYGTATPIVEVPFTGAAINMGSTTLALTKAIWLRGQGSGEFGGAATWLTWDAGVNGIVVDAPNVRITDLGIRGGWVYGVTAEGEFHGIKAHWKFTYDNLIIFSFQGDGIHINVSAGSGGDTEGNANGVWGERSAVSGCRDGLFIQGADANAGNFTGINTLANRRWGIWDNSFLGNHHSGHHASTNGIWETGGSVPYGMVHLAGHHYTVAIGQEAAASVNSPSGTGADTTYWLYAHEGPASTFVPTWFSGISVRSSGPYFSGISQFRDCYAEGDQGVTQLINNGAALGPAFFSGVKGTGRWEHSVTGGSQQGVITNAGYRFTGENPNFNGPAGIELYMFGGAGIISAYSRDSAASVPLIIGAASYRFDILGVTVGGLTNKAMAMPGLTVNGDLGNYVSGGFHRAQINATGTQTPLVFSGGNGAIEIWKDATPSKAVSFGMGLSGGVANDDFIFGRYNGVAWAEMARFENATKDLLLQGNIKIAATTVINSAGTLQAGAMPALTGDVTTAAGSVATKVESATPSDGSFNVTGTLVASGAITGSNLSGTNTGDQTITLTGDVTGTGTGSFATAIGANKVLDTMVRQSSALSVIGRSANSIGNVADIAGTSNQVLRVNGSSVLGFGAVDLSTAMVTGDLAFSNIAPASAASKLLGRGSASGAGDFQEITLGSNLSMSGTTLSASSGSDWTYVPVTSDFTTSSAGAVDVIRDGGSAVLGFAPAANTNYEFEAKLMVRTATATVGPRVALNWATGLTDGVADIYITSATSTEVQQHGNAVGGQVTGPVGGLPNTTASWPARVSGIIQAGASPSGNVRVQLASETAGTDVKIMTGSFLRYRTY